MTKQYEMPFDALLIEVEYLEAIECEELSVDNILHIMDVMIKGMKA